jgi:hypothetical protein
LSQYTFELTETFVVLELGKKCKFKSLMKYKSRVAADTTLQVQGAETIGSKLMGEKHMFWPSGNYDAILFIYC